MKTILLSSGFVAGCAAGILGTLLVGGSGPRALFDPGQRTTPGVEETTTTPVRAVAVSSPGATGVASLVQIDPRLIDRFESGAEPGAFSDLELACVTAWFKESDPLRLLDFAKRFPPGLIANGIRLEAMEGIAAKNPATAWGLLEQLGPGATHTEAAARILEAWAGKDPSAAIEAAESLSPEDGGTLERFAHKLAMADPTLAARWCMGQDAENVDRIRDAVIEGAFATADVENVRPKADALMAMLRDQGDARESIATGIAREMSLVDGGAALAWAETLEGAERAKAMEVVIGHLAGSAPSDAAEALRIELAGQKEISPTVLTDVAAAMSMQDAEEAWAWANQLPKDQRAEATRVIIAAWARDDAASASDWLARQPDSEVKVAAAAALAAEIAKLDPGAANAWQEFARRKSNDPETGGGR